ncbi:hypothetical protein DL767_001469 [Monosporascus sp. MG133]|nr:hypothetical protein DL767_001469 [Monosporascus sp. MG133]
MARHRSATTTTTTRRSSLLGAADDDSHPLMAAGMNATKYFHEPWGTQELGPYDQRLLQRGGAVRGAPPRAGLTCARGSFVEITGVTERGSLPGLWSDKNATAKRHSLRGRARLGAFDFAEILRAEYGVESRYVA